MTKCPCTQLQDAIDELAHQFHATLNYLNTAHDFVPLTSTQTKASDPCVQPDPAAQFEETQRSLSAKLIEQTKQIETMIDTLPGVFETEAQQLTRLAALESERKALAAQKQALCAEKEQLLAQLDRVVLHLSFQRRQLLQRSLCSPAQR
ncbi:hypothetical protein PORY_002670 [Pneumocystis oryctolagi]|uniref:Uncharacterized protein n=1 Tax=Pneumocystis oryctolagi TaxID=42067 RepID=A0ACB7C8V4_9ASCO|nr:hypothetical protein PORY_002670 [Pneumocystis oryctolagi]